MAHDCAADAEGLRAIRRIVEQGREGAGIRRHRRHVASRRHAAGRIHQELDRLWDQVRPLYLELHAYVRMSCAPEILAMLCPEMAASGSPARNIWAQDWQNIYPLVSPANADAATPPDILKKRNISATRHGRTGGQLHLALGFAALPKTFWDRSLFVRPRDREVVCHASAWDIDMSPTSASRCASTRPREDFTTIHHSSGTTSISA